MNSKLTAALLILAAVLANVGFTALGSTFNYPDVLIVANQYQISIPPPFIPGSELAGVVSAVGSDVTDYQPGDRVSSTTFVGT